MAKTADPLAVTWTERYSKTLDRIWSKIPNVIGSFIATVAVFLLGATIHGKLKTETAAAVVVFSAMSKIRMFSTNQVTGS